VIMGKRSGRRSGKGFKGIPRPEIRPKILFQDRIYIEKARTNSPSSTDLKSINRDENHFIEKLENRVDDGRFSRDFGRGNGELEILTVSDLLNGGSSDDSHPTYITKHIEGDVLQLHLDGSLRFGTLENYRGKEMTIQHRFRDGKEGKFSEVIRPSGNFIEYANINGIVMRNNYFEGVYCITSFDHHVNDYCYCSSIGPYDSQRAMKLKLSGNEELTHYVVYDLARLKQAILALLRERFGQAPYELVGKIVEYGEKDITIFAGSRFIYRSSGDLIGVWARAAFVKPADFIDEEEFRLMVTRTDRVGKLGSGATHLDFKSVDIKNSIVSWGKIQADEAGKG